MVDLTEDGVKWAVGLAILGLAIVVFVLPYFSSSPAVRGFAFVPAPVREAVDTAGSKFNAFVGVTPLPGGGDSGASPGATPVPGSSTPALTPGQTPGVLTPAATPGPSPTPAASPVATPLQPPKNLEDAINRYNNVKRQAEAAQTAGEYVKAQDLYGAAKMDLDTAKSLGLDDAGYKKENAELRGNLEALGELQKHKPAGTPAPSPTPEEGGGGRGWGSVGAVVAVLVLLPLLAGFAWKKGLLSKLKPAKSGATAAAGASSTSPKAASAAGPFAIAFYRGSAFLDPANPIALQPSASPNAPNFVSIAASIVRGGAPVLPGVKNNIRFTVVSNNADAFISGERRSWLFFGDRSRQASKAGQSVNVWLDASGRASVEIVAGTKPGVLVIRASWLALRESRKAFSGKSTAEQVLTVHIGNPADAQAAPAQAARPSGIVLHLKAEPSSFVLDDAQDRKSVIIAKLEKDGKGFYPKLANKITFKVESAPAGCKGFVVSGKNAPLRPGVSLSDTFSHHSASPMLFVRLDDVAEAGTLRVSASWSSFLRPIRGSKEGVTYAVSYVDVTINEPSKRQKPSYALSLSADPAEVGVLDPANASRGFSAIEAALFSEDSGSSRPVAGHKLVFFVGSFRNGLGLDLDPAFCDFSLRSVDGKQEVSAIGEDKGGISVFTGSDGTAKVMFHPGLQRGTAVVCVSHYVLGQASPLDTKSVPVGVGLKPAEQYDVDFRVSPGSRDSVSGEYLSLVPTGAFLALSARVCANGKAVKDSDVGFRVLDDGGTGAQLVSFEKDDWVPKEGLRRRMDGADYARVDLSLGRKPGRIALEAFCVKQPKVSRRIFVQLKIDDKPDFGLSLTADACQERPVDENGLGLAYVISSGLTNHGVPVGKRTPIVFVLDDASFSAGVRLGSGENKANKHVDASSPQICLVFVPGAVKHATVKVRAYCERNPGVSCDIVLDFNAGKGPVAHGSAGS